MLKSRVTGNDLLKTRFIGNLLAGFILTNGNGFILHSVLQHKVQTQNLLKTFKHRVVSEEQRQNSGKTTISWQAYQRVAFYQKHNKLPSKFFESLFSVDCRDNFSLVINPCKQRNMVGLG